MLASMLGLSAYMDETGHSQDERQRFNGMAGLIAPSDSWGKLASKWNATLKDFGIPFFHMKDFAQSKGFFKGWNEAKRRKLFGKLILHMEVIYALPIGTIIPMNEFRSFIERRQQQRQQSLFAEPYFFCFMAVTALSTTYLEYKRAPADEKIALTFSDQVEFRHRALQLYDEFRKTGLSIHRSASAPEFRDMREHAPLQAADIVAYELYKEYERLRHRPDDEQRFGYQRLVKMSERHGRSAPAFKFHTKASLGEYARIAEQAAKRNVSTKGEAI